jgi:ribonuclease P protein component
MRLNRILKRSAFLAAASSGRRCRSRSFNIQIIERADHAQLGLRVGLTASRKTGNSVERNRIRRRLREAADIAFKQHDLGSVDLVVIARREVLSEPFNDLISALTETPHKAKFPHARSTKLH